MNKGTAALVGGMMLTLVACGGGSEGGGVSGGTSPAPITPPAVISTPGAPTDVVAIAGRASATVSFTAPGNNGGSAITGYTVSTSPAGGIDSDAGSTTLNHVVTGLSNGVSYTFTVTATNAAGVSVASGVSNTATPEQPVHWSATGSLQTARAGHTATLLPDGKVLVVGGTTSAAGVAASAVELYDPVSKDWKLVGRTSVSPYGHTATLLPNGKLLVGFELYDPANNTVTALPSPSTVGRDLVGYYGLAATLLPNGKVLLTGGYLGDNTDSKAARLFDPATNTWADVPPMAAARSFHTSTLLRDGRTLVYGGAGVAEIYDPASNRWTTAARPPVTSLRVSATLLANGKVLFVPGRVAERNATVYDPVTDTWSLAGTISTNRGDHTATLLSNGTVLITGGGVYTESTATDTSELYDPATNTWSATTPLVLGPRAGHTATLLRDGSVLVVGGSDEYGWGRPTRANAALYELL
ncbi:fibronectin type III domain-containing protein [Rhodoferax sp. AJA081-3]|uniref:kelch repeat-containing protein n=1 Tax=Rhodoferax sp. AJA081-3 TaxID=2752316 RepID=UPI001AE088AA|nr:kelch repeat-containing protein [Rhodoferax sp. AJA081-3]QTN27311.1 fibronectin type III domain-containing protein [Rhodoferax sp. AJA081-3]